MLITSICDEARRKLGELGIKNISTTIYTIIDKKGVVREIGNKAMPHFRN